MSRLKKITALVAVLLAIYYLKIKPKQGKVVDTASGPVSGIISVSRDGREFYEWLGVPYAAPPTGHLRFASPQPIQPWDTPRDASSYGSACAQIYFLAMVQLGNEDCLTLNIHTPIISQLEGPPKQKLLPVVIYFHGGAFMWGSSWEYRPDYFMDHDVIMVTINYRLNLFGFLSTGDESIRGNMGLKDQALAIKWVHTNIQAFGGDPARITLLGESAGAVSVHYQMLSSQTEGLFTKAMALSGSAGGSWRFTEPEKALEKTIKIATYLNCPTPPDSASMTACLKEADASELLNSIRTDIRDSFLFLPQKTGHIFSPTIEPPNSDAFLTDPPLKILEGGKAQRVPFLTGVVADEGLLSTWSFYNNPKNLELFEANFEERIVEVCHLISMQNRSLIARTIKEYYFPPLKLMTYEEKLDSFKNLFGDCFFNFGVHVGADIQRRFSQVYLYFFDIHQGPSLIQALTNYGDSFPALIETALAFGKMYFKEMVLGIPREDVGINHADDIFLAFPSVVTIKKGDKFYDLSKSWVKFLVDFATQERVDFEGVELKPVWKEGPLKYLEISEDPKVMTPKFAERVEFLRKIGVN